MKKIVRCTLFCLLIGAVFLCGSVLVDKTTLQEDLIRLHVVANSDSEADQANKLRVRDAVMSYMAEMMQTLPDADAAEAFLRDQIPQLESLANDVLKELGTDQTASVTLLKEPFGVRHYDSFSLPSGVYRSLRITIGEGAGKNWWCVVFPSLCIPAAGDSMEDTAVGAGFSQGLTGALKQERGYEVRFFLLDVFGRLENFFFKTGN